eukprot:CAMPEP_0176422450 /NCGR_PEP_ID=MMETSP0127-20121128/9738_1 /TAXON_ID=938130 /ORGANISM="Platyophrya macrostoma, Strain WH" /LENGTH=236 /DNA_ID=CAMNT_0017803297 /DNA_START=198 /DNA_END=906 /DNA_ORIENTATION=-
MGVGKTSLAARYVKDTFRDFTNPTIGASYLWRKEHIDAKEVKFSIWDTAGQEQFYALVPMYFRDADAVILVVDVTRDSCESEALLWLDKVKQSAPSTALVFMALNKIDAAEDRRYTLEAAEAFVSHNASFRMECGDVSAKSGEGVHEFFENIGRKCMYRGSGGDYAPSKGRADSSAVRLGGDANSNKRRGQQAEGGIEEKRAVAKSVDACERRVAGKKLSDESLAFFKTPGLVRND